MIFPFFLAWLFLSATPSMGLGKVPVKNKKISARHTPPKKTPSSTADTEGQDVNFDDFPFLIYATDVEYTPSSQILKATGHVEIYHFLEELSEEEKRNTEKTDRAASKKNGFHKPIIMSKAKKEDAPQSLVSFIRGHKIHSQKVEKTQEK